MSLRFPALRRLQIGLFATFGLALVTSAAWAEEEVVLTEEGGGSAAAKPTPAPQVIDENAGVMVRPFSGPKSQTIHDKVVATLEAEGIVLIPAGFEEGVKLGDAPGPYVEVARKNQIKAYVHGTTKMTKREWSVTLKVRNAKDGKPVGEVRFSGASLPGLLKKIDAQLMSDLDAPLLKTAVPGKNDKASKKKDADPEVEAVSLEAEGSADSGNVSITDSEPPVPAEPTRDRSASPSPLDVRVGAGVLQRFYDYYKDVADSYEHALNQHPLIAAAVHVGAHWYPGAHKGDGVLANIGIGVNYYMSVGGSNTVVSSDNVARKFSTNFTEFDVGLRGRIPLGGVELGLNGSWGFQSLVMEGDNESPSAGGRVDPGLTPDIRYTFFRFGPDVHFDFGAPIEIGVAYRVATLKSADGYLAEDRWFPAASAVGVDAHAAFGIDITDTVDLKIGGELRYYGINANPGSADENLVQGGHAYAGNPEYTNVLGPDAWGLNHAVAAGAADLYIGGFVMGEYVLPGVAR